MLFYLQFELLFLIYYCGISSAFDLIVNTLLLPIINKSFKILERFFIDHSKQYIGNFKYSQDNQTEILNERENEFQTKKVKTKTHLCFKK